MSEDFIEDPKIGDIESPALRDFFSIWQTLCEEHGSPARADFSLTLFAEHLPHMAINEYDRDTGRFFVRLFGSGYVNGIGADLTNKFVDEIPNTEGLLARYAWLVENKRPYLSRDNRLDWSSKNYRNYNVLACPLFDDLGDVTTLMFRIEFSDPPDL